MGKEGKTGGGGGGEWGHGRGGTGGVGAKGSEKQEITRGKRVAAPSTEYGRCEGGGEKGDERFKKVDGGDEMGKNRCLEMRQG